MNEMRPLPKYLKDDLGGFVADLRSLLPKKSQASLAQDLNLTHPTISRYESNQSRPSLGFVATLAKLVVDKLGYAEENDVKNLQGHFLGELNRAIRDCYFPDEEPFKDWAELSVIADAYLTKQRTHLTKQHAKQSEIAITIRFDISLLTPERQADIIKAFAVLLGIKPQDVELHGVRQGSIVFDLGIPVEAVQRLRSLLQSNNEQLHRLRIEKILLEKEADEPETWAVKDGKFYQVNLTQTTTVAGVGNTTIGNVTGTVVFGDPNRIGSPQPILAGDSVNKIPKKQKFTNKTKTPPKSSKGMVKAIIVGVGAAGLLVGCVLLAAVAWYAGLLDQIPGFGSAKLVTITVQVVAEADGAIIPRAQAILFADGERYVEATDTTGAATFAAVPVSGRANLSLVVEAQGYQIYNLDNLSRPTDGLVKVLLRPQEGNEANVIVLVTNETQEAVSGATVVLLVEGNSFTQPTDSNGIAKFPIVFAQDKVEAQMRVSTPDYETEAQNVTLLPDKVQGIRLNPQQKTLEQVGIESSFQGDAAAGSTTPAAGEFAINQTLSMNPADFVTTLQAIQVSSGTMRWSFEFWNKTGKAYDVYFNKNSYVVDDLGNRYAVVKELAIGLQAGERATQSVEFEEPKPGATVFTLYWGYSGGASFSNPAASVSIPASSNP